MSDILNDQLLRAREAAARIASDQQAAASLVDLEKQAATRAARARTEEAIDAARLDLNYNLPRWEAVKNRRDQAISEMLAAFKLAVAACREFDQATETIKALYGTIASGQADLRGDTTTTLQNLLVDVLRADGRYPLERYDAPDRSDETRAALNGLTYFAALRVHTD